MIEERGERGLVSNSVACVTVTYERAAMLHDDGMDRR